MSNIKVVNFYHLKSQIPEDGVYIGRAYYKFSLKHSIFANPFKLTDEKDRSLVISKYEDWLISQILEGKIKKEDFLFLENKKLVCFCKPKNCHGDIVKKYADFIINNPNYTNDDLLKLKQIYDTASYDFKY